MGRAHVKTWARRARLFRVWEPILQGALGPATTRRQRPMSYRVNVSKTCIYVYIFIGHIYVCIYIDEGMEGMYIYIYIYIYILRILMCIDRYIYMYIYIYYINVYR